MTVAINYKEYDENIARIEELRKQAEELADRSERGLLDINAEKAERIAIYWQNIASAGNFSYNWFSKWESVFQKIGEKYGLLEIFRENGIL